MKIHPAPPRLRLLFVLASSALLGGTPAAPAAPFVWDGGGADDNFATAANWNPNGAPPNNGTADLQFAGTVRLTPAAEAAYGLNSLAFNANAGAFILGGGALTIGAGGLGQNSPNAQTINNAVVLGLSQSWTFASGAGALTLGNDLIVSASGTGPTLSLSAGTLNLPSTGNAFYVGASANETGRVNLSGSASVTAQTTYVGLDGTGFVTQTGGSLSLPVRALYLAFRTPSTGSYALSGANSSLSTTTTFVAYRGTATFTQSGGTHTTGQLSVAPVVQGTPPVGTYHLDGGTLRAGSIVTGASAPFGTSTFNFNGGTLEASAAGTTFFQGLTTANVRDNGAKIDTHGFNVIVAQPLLHSGIPGDAATDDEHLKTGAGTLTLTGANTYNGGTLVNVGTLALDVGGTLGSAGNLGVAAGATLNFSALGSSGYTLGSGRTLTNLGTVAGNLTIGSGATLTGAGTVNGGLGVNSGGLVSLLTGGALSVAGNVINGGTIRLERGAALAVSGIFVNNGTLDVIPRSFSAPAGFINNGTLLDSRVVKTKSVTRSGGTVTVTMDSYSGHTYQFQRRTSLSGGAFANLGAPQAGSTGTTLAFTDPAPAAVQCFYRVVIDP